MDDSLQATCPSTSKSRDNCVDKPAPIRTTTTLRRDYGDEAPSTSRQESIPPLDALTSTTFARCMPRAVDCRTPSSDCRQRPPTAPIIGALAILNFLMTFGAVNGYVVGRLLTLERGTYRPIVAKDYIFASGPRRPYGNDGDDASAAAREGMTEVTPEMMYVVLRDVIEGGSDDGAQRTRRAGRWRKSKLHVAVAYPASTAESQRNGAIADSSCSASAERNEERVTAVPLDLLKRKFRRDLDTVTRTTQKKSVLKSLKKFGSNNVRNCFFTPIQCMIQHDMSKYKKLIENNSDGFTTTKI